MGSKNISMKPYDHFESGKKKEKKRQFLIDKKQCLCENGGLYPITAIKGKYIPGNLYNHIKETFIKNWRCLSVLGFDLSEGITNFTNHDISESNMRCEIFIRELRQDMSKKVSY